MIEYVKEYDLSQEYSDFFHVQSKTCKKNFERRHIPTAILEDKEGVYAFIDSFLLEHPDIKSIAFSDGVTLYQLDLFDFVRDTYGESYDVDQPLRRSKTGHYYVFGEQPKGPTNFPWEEYKPKIDSVEEAARKALNSDLLIVSANGISMNGEIISIDGMGNRVSGMIFGPKHVMVIVGRNKIYPNEEIAVAMVRNRVAPLTYIRHMNKHYTQLQNLPCLKIGKCVDCVHDASACRNLVVVRGQTNGHKDRIHLVLVNQDLGI